MSMPNNKRMGERPSVAGRSDHFAKSIFSRMGQGEMTRKPLQRGLEAQMGQHARIKAGKGRGYCSINSTMGQGG